MTLLLPIKSIRIALDLQDENEDKAEIINSLRMRKTRHLLAPLLEGELK